MSRILFVSIPEKGHLNPMIGPAVHLRDRGHTVAFHAEGNVCDQLARAGLDWTPETALKPVLSHNRGAEFAQRVRDSNWLRSWIAMLLVEKAEAQIAPLRDVIRRFRPNVVVLDPMIYAAVIAAHQEGVAWVSLSNSLNPVLNADVHSELLDTVAWLSRGRADLFRRHGMVPRFSGCDTLSPHLTVAFTTEEFIGYTPPGVHLVGPSLPPNTRGDETEFSFDSLWTDLPLVYVSFGSQIYHQPQIFRLLAEASEGLGAQVLIAAQQLHDSPEMGALPSHVHTCGYAPQLSILPKAQLFVTHGGANSVMEAMHFGVPLLISPMCNDQYHQAHYIMRSGIGESLDLASANVRDVRECLRKLLVEPRYRERLRPITASYQRDGAREAARLIENLA